MAGGGVGSRRPSGGGARARGLEPPPQDGGADERHERRRSEEHHECRAPERRPARQRRNEKTRANPPTTPKRRLSCAAAVIDARQVPWGGEQCQPDRHRQEEVRAEEAPRVATQGLEGQQRERQANDGRKGWAANGREPECSTLHHALSVPASSHVRALLDLVCGAASCGGCRGAPGLSSSQNRMSTDTRGAGRSGRDSRGLSRRSRDGVFGQVAVQRRPADALRPRRRSHRRPALHKVRGSP